MKLESKFDIGEAVYFYDDENKTVLRGTIGSISLRFDGEVARWEYFIKPERKEDEFIELGKYHKEQFIFRNRNEIFEFAYKLTEGL